MPNPSRPVGHHRGRWGMCPASSEISRREGQMEYRRVYTRDARHAVGDADVEPTITVAAWAGASAAVLSTDQCDASQS